MSYSNDLDRARDALYAIPADLPRDEWVKAGMAAQSAGLTFEDFDVWSSQAPSYKQNDCRDTWRSFKPGKGISAGTLYGMACKCGWTDGKHAAPRPVMPAPKPAEPPRKPKPGESAAEVWGRALPATAQHPYATKKQASQDALQGLRVLPADDTLAIGGNSMGGALAVPCWRDDGSLSTLQLIPPAGKKMNLPAHRVDGKFTVGKIEPGKTVYIVEGIGQAWACWQSTGAAAVVCFGIGNMGKVSTALRQKWPDVHLVLVPDRGQEEKAQKIATEVGAAMAEMPADEPSNFDANDLFCRDGFDVLAALLESASEPPKPEPKVHPLALFVDFDGTVKPPEWVIPGFIPANGVVTIAGAPGVGKTTALLPLAMTAAGLHGDYQLLPVQWRHVIYITEDLDQAQRILAGIVSHGNLNIGFDLVRERLHIVKAVRLDPAYVASVGTAYRELFTRTVQGVEVLPLVVIDTRSAVLAMENENDNSETSSMLAALKQGFSELPIWLVGHGHFYKFP